MNHSTLLKADYPEPGIGVGGILFNDCREVLLIKRNQPPAQGYWSIPGGKLEAGESLVEACCREFYEETNLSVAVQHVAAVVDRRLEGFHYVIIDFCVELIDRTNAQPLAQSDVLEARWVPLAELGRYELVIGLADIINRVYCGQSNPDSVGLLDRNQSGTDFF
ncbi:MAG: NUDIX domain-containing protein [Gammaproteobacteria bacterium]|nr:NUDIX domain-containing protein [Gammaproteobacteria bacterium]